MELGVSDYVIDATLLGVRPLRLAGAMRVSEGLTVIGEVLASTPPLS
jgi:general secretion pathway protein E